MFSVRQTPWHGLGTIVQEAPTSKDALHLAGLDWTVRQEPLVYYEQDTGYKMNIRSTDNKVLGVVGGRYQPIQNVEAFSFMDELMGDGVTYETAGSLTTGKRIWLLARMPEKKILDDKVDPYMVLTNAHDGGTCLKVCMTPVRVVCQNTLNMALDGAKRTWTARHTKSFDQKMAEARHTLGMANIYMDNLSREAEDLYKIKISDEKFKWMSETLFPIAPDATNRKEDSQLLLRSQLKSAWCMPDLGNIKGTGWGFMNAVSDMTTHRPPARKSDNYQENNFMFTIDAPYILDAALKMTREVI